VVADKKDKKDDKINGGVDKKDNKKEPKAVDEKVNAKNENNNKVVPPKENKKKVVEDDPPQDEESQEETPNEVTPPKVEENNNNNDDDKNVEEIENSKIPIFNVGDEVVLTKDRMGIIRFKGRVPEMGFGIFYGVELTDGSVGHNDGQIKGVRYFQTEEKRAMFVGHEKFRRKMTARDHKRIDSFHAASKNSDGKQSPKQANQDDEKDPIISASEQERQRQESITQRDPKELASVDGFEAAKKNMKI